MNYSDDFTQKKFKFITRAHKIFFQFHFCVSLSDFARKTSKNLVHQRFEES
jgi:hypothetical protein